MKRRTALAAIGAGLLSGVATPLLAQQDFPTRTIKIIAPYPPGGTTDLFARIIGDYLQKTWGQTVVIENRPGSSGMIGAGMVARSPGDGYTVLIGSQALYSVNPTLYKQVPYDPVKDFTPISLVALLPSFLVVPATLPVANVREFIQYVKDNPGKVAYGSAGSGTAQHIYFELFKQQMGLDVLHVPYKGSVPAVTDLIGGRVQAMMDFGPSVLPHIRAGKLKALAVSTGERSRATPDVPTMQESGVPGFDNATWFAIHGPAGIPPTIATKLSTEIAAAMRNPEVKARFESLGIETIGTTADVLLARQKADAVKFAEVIRRANIKVD
ncbi:tripartite tricarboxylate transporter substrate binding protein [Lacisediminimonas sp.]|uniref:Bug family tripartite tricarboxylate transporter substrate binding protein n=1 Tax=Lacisediminimonas sp. TaxID=3060582 RepID=UPI002723B80A|nr:tripartite tricarboxylate transporter substrate binding protein [Lacisediminimonas sp.]MDO8298415.1 tripartite tricarboxylate transporter substrate binding protein [Lacisediminimonas sp.]